MSEHTVNGKLTKVHDHVHYTDSTGRKHKLTIDHVDGNKANLSGTIDGQFKQFTSVPHSPDGEYHTWNHYED
jgi:hypothetical protein